MRVELQHVSIPMPRDGHERARWFYGELLGLEEREVPPKLDPSQLVWFRAGGDLELHCFVSDEPVPRAQHCCFRLDAAGASAAKPPTPGKKTPPPPAAEAAWTSSARRSRRPASSARTRRRSSGDLASWPETRSGTGSS